MNRTNQSTIIKEKIRFLIEKEGIKDKQTVYTKVVELLDVPRPTVRRVAADLRNDLLEQIKILQSEQPTISSTIKKTA